MKVIIIAIILSALSLSNSFATCVAKTINPEDSYEEAYPRKQRPKRDPKKTENEEAEFVRQEDTFVG